MLDKRVDAVDILIPVCDSFVTVYRFTCKLEEVHLYQFMGHSYVQWTTNAKEILRPERNILDVALRGILRIIRFDLPCVNSLADDARHLISLRFT